MTAGDGGVGMTWNQESKLVCPHNKVGEVDVYQVTHHGLDSSNNPVVLNSVKPTVSIMNNGTKKGCLPEVLANLKACESIEAMYQVHKNLRPDGSVNNAPDEYIANHKSKCDANYIKLSVTEDSREYTVSIPANSHARRFKTKLTSLQSSANTTRFEQDQQALLWPDGAPNVKGDQPTDQPALTIHLPEKSIATGTGVVVNPGGGYHILAADHEGLQVARELNRRGIAAFVLRYRLKPTYEIEDALVDAKRAIRFVRHHAKVLHLNPNRIGMMGFSAGGHLTSNAGTQFDHGDESSEDPIDRQSSRPDFLGLVYPAISGELFKREQEYPSTHRLVTKDTPPAFLVHTHEDWLSPNHSVHFYQALLKHKVPAELHVFGYGPHGTGLAPGDPDLGSWPELMANWLRRSGLLTSRDRAAISGVVTVDGDPLFWGWLTLVPVEENHPVVTAYIEWNNKGKYAIDSAHGPVPGKYRVEVRRVATEFNDQKGGSYSMHDAELLPYTTTIEIGEGKHEFDIHVK